MHTRVAGSQQGTRIGMAPKKTTYPSDLASLIRIRIPKTGYDPYKQPIHPIGFLYSENPQNRFIPGSSPARLVIPPSSLRTRWRSPRAACLTTPATTTSARGRGLESGKRKAGVPSLDCYWVGSVDFNFLGKSSCFFSTNPPKKLNFLQGGQQQPRSTTAIREE